MQLSFTQPTANIFYPSFSFIFLDEASTLTFSAAKLVQATFLQVPGALFSEFFQKLFFSEQELNQFASFYLDKWDENTSEDVVAESFVDYWWNTDRACRRCSECGKLMREGYCADMGVAYYCSKDCLHSDFMDEEWAKECESNDQSYYTEW